MIVEFHLKCIHFWPQKQNISLNYSLSHAYNEKYMILSLLLIFQIDQNGWSIFEYETLILMSLT